MPSHFQIVNSNEHYKTYVFIQQILQLISVVGLDTSQLSSVHTAVGSQQAGTQGTRKSGKLGNKIYVMITIYSMCQVCRAFSCFALV